MNELFLPLEWVIIGTVLSMKKNIVSAEEVNTYYNRAAKSGIKLEFSDEPFKFVTEYEDGNFAVGKFPTIDPRVMQLLTSF